MSRVSQHYFMVTLALLVLALGDMAFAQEAKRGYNRRLLAGLDGDAAQIVSSATDGALGTAISGVTENGDAAKVAGSLLNGAGGADGAQNPLTGATGVVGTAADGVGVGNVANGAALNGAGAGALNSAGTSLNGGGGGGGQ